MGSGYEQKQQQKAASNAEGGGKKKVTAAQLRAQKGVYHLFFFSFFPSSGVWLGRFG